MARSERSVRLLAGLALAAAFGLAACEGILGLGKFKDCTEPGADCSVDAAPPDASDAGQPDGADTGLPDVIDAEPPLPDGAVRSSWASWKMPNSSAYDAAGLGPGFLTTYGSLTPTVVGGVAAVREARSNLVWLDKNLTAGTFEEALGRCAEQGPEWRLPTRIELVSLLDYGNDAGYGPPGGFSALAGKDTYWTSSVAVNRGKDSLFWLVNFTTGAVTRAATTTDASRVVCIRGA